MEGAALRMRGLLELALAVLLTACASSSVLPSSSPTPDSEPAEAGSEPGENLLGFFSAEQAERGRESYRKACSECHAVSEFRGSDFEWTWRRRTAWSLYREVSSTMPEDQPGKLSTETYADIVAYLLSLNDYPIGSAELLPTEEVLAAIPLGAGVRKTKSKE